MADHKGARCCGRCLGRGWYRKGQLTVDCERGCPRVEPTPVRLSADMLGEEDLKQVMVYLEELRPFYEAAYRLYAKHTGGQIHNERLDGLITTMVKIDRLLGKGE